MVVANVRTSTFSKLLRSGPWPFGLNDLASRTFKVYLLHWLIVCKAVTDSELTFVFLDETDPWIIVIHFEPINTMNIVSLTIYRIVWDSVAHCIEGVIVRNQVVLCLLIRGVLVLRDHHSQDVGSSTSSVIYEMLIQPALVEGIIFEFSFEGAMKSVLDLLDDDVVHGSISFFI